MLCVPPQAPSVRELARRQARLRECRVCYAVRRDRGEGTPPVSFADSPLNEGAGVASLRGKETPPVSFADSPLSEGAGVASLQGKGTPPVSFADSPLNEGAWGAPGFVHPPGSLFEGAGSPSGETEGVSF